MIVEEIKNNGDNFEIGNYSAKTRKDLGSNIVKDFNLFLDDNNDSNIGRIVKFKNPTCVMEEKYTYRIIGRQKAWGYDENGNYSLFPAYRGVPVEIDDQFGRPIHLYEVEFI